MATVKDRRKQAAEVDLDAVIALAASAPADGDGVSEPFEVLRAGEYVRGGGRKVSVSEDDLDAAVSNFKRWKEAGGDIPVDYDHSFAEAGDSKAAGWFTELTRKGKSLFARVKWTPKAAQQIRDGEYRFFSPEFTANWRDEHGSDEGFTILAGALTNRPFLRGMTPVAMSQEVEAVAFEAMAEAFAELQEEVAKGKSGGGDETHPRVAKATDKPEQPEKFSVEIDGEATEFTADEIVEMHAKAAKAEQAETGKEEAKSDAEKMTARVEKLETDLTAERFNTAFTTALREGKIDAKPETREKWDKRLEKFGLDGVKELLEDLPAGKVPVGDPTGRGGGEQRFASDAPDGTDPEAFALHEKAEEIVAERFDGDSDKYGEAVRLAETELAKAGA
jgi:phage I-like protein